jgi:type IV secretory pathway TrbF-like protein
MWRILAVLTLILSGTLAGSSIWMLFHPSVTPFLVPGATDIQVVGTGVWEWQIAYAAPGPPYG